MAKLHVFITIAVAFTMFAQANPDKESSEKPEKESAKTRLINANTQLTGECLYQLNQKHPDTSRMTSVVYLLSSLAQLAKFLDGSIFQAIMDLINLKSIEEVTNIFPVGLKELNPNEDGNPLKLNMKLYVDKCRKYTTEFSSYYRKIFGGKTDYLDISKPQDAARAINNYVDCQICEPGTRIISQEAIDKKMGMVFVATFEAVANLTGDFVAECITEIDFHVNKQLSLKLPAVRGSGTVKYGKIGNMAETFLIPVGGNKNSLFLVKPNNTCNGLQRTLELFRDYREFNNVLKSLKSKKVTLTFPLGKVSGHIDFAECVKSSGILLELFRPCGADFKNVFKDKNCVHISNMLQKMRLTTNIGLNKCDSDSPACPNSTSDEYVIDHPFLYYLLCSKSSPAVAGLYYA